MPLCLKTYAEYVFIFCLNGTIESTAKYPSHTMVFTRRQEGGKALTFGANNLSQPDLGKKLVKLTFTNLHSVDVTFQFLIVKN